MPSFIRDAKAIPVLPKDRSDTTIFVGLRRILHQMKVEVTSGLSGRGCLILNFKANMQISTIKKEVANRWGVPLPCIKLVHNELVLQDDWQVAFQAFY